MTKHEISNFISKARVIGTQICTRYGPYFVQVSKIDDTALLCLTPGFPDKEDDEKVLEEFRHKGLGSISNLVVIGTCVKSVNSLPIAMGGFPNIDVTRLDTSNMTNMSEMFKGAKIDNLDLSSFDTSKVTSMRGMFQNAKIDQLDLSSFDTSKVTNMIRMFWGAKIDKLDLSSFDTSKVTNMQGMFKKAKIGSLDLSGCYTYNVKYMDSMFKDAQIGCLDLSGFDTSNGTNTLDIFTGAKIGKLIADDPYILAAYKRATK